MSGMRIQFGGAGFDRIRTRFVAALALMFGLMRVLAHDPFDCSARMEVGPERIDLAVTLGVDAARHVLASSGMSSNEVAFALRPRGPRAFLTLPPEISKRFFVLNQGGEEIVATNAVELSEGMEVIFTLSYPRPAAGIVDVRAACYESIPEIRNGSLVAYDESGQQLGIALLSRASVTAQVRIPETGTPVASEAPIENLNSPSDTSVPVEAVPSSPSFTQFFKLGVEHILIGFDHLLFLVALLIGVRKPLGMLGIITCFTLAHSVTLALAALNLVNLSPRVVEPLIAASIIVVCVENFFRRDVVADRLWLASGFGLIHGFGFAGVLRETGFWESGASIAVPLLSFNLGVEAGQIAVAAVVLPLLFSVRRWKPFERFGATAISTAVILISSYWLLERTVLSR